MTTSEVLVLNADPVDDTTGELLQQSYTTGREAEWVEFLADCAKYRDELVHEIATAKFTLAELEEEEQSLDRLRRWHRGLTLRDHFGAPSSGPAAHQLKTCTALLEDFSEQVYRALGQT